MKISKPKVRYVRNWTRRPHPWFFRFKNPRGDYRFYHFGPIEVSYFKDTK